MVSLPRLGSLAVVLAAALEPSAVEAQREGREPIVLVVESADPAVSPSGLRDRLGEVLGARVHALGVEPVGAIVMVRVGARGPAAVRIHRSGQSPRAVRIERGSGSWLVEGLAEAMRGAALVDWEGRAHVPRGPPLAEWVEPADGPASPASARPAEGAEGLDPPPRSP